MAGITETMTEFAPDVLIVGSGPAGLGAALALSNYGVPTRVITRHNWLANTPRAHVTNQRTFEIFRDLGIEQEVNDRATPYSSLPDAIFCTSLAGQELARIRGFGTGAQNCGNYLSSSPCRMADIPQDVLEPILLGAATSRGAQVSFHTEYLSSVQDEDGVTSTLQDRLAGDTFTVRSKYLIGADGGNSRIAAELALPMEGEMDLSGSINILFDADLTQYLRHRPAFLYFFIRTGWNTDGVGLGFLRPIRRWTRWLLTIGYVLGGRPAELSHAEAMEIVRDYLGDSTLAIEIRAIAPWNLNAMYATKYRSGRIFCAGDAVHRHVPSNGLGSNTSLQDSYNLAWKLAWVLKGKAAPSLLDSYEEERVPVGRQVVQRATKSLHSYNPILEALGLLGTATPEEGIANMNALYSASPAAAAQRQRLRAAIAAKDYEFNAHGVEMNQRYRSCAVVAEEIPPTHAHGDEELCCLPSTAPGARLPHAWIQRDGRALSTLDLVGQGAFSVITGIGGEAWFAAAASAFAEFDIPIKASAIGPGCTFTDLYGEWDQLREIEESGCLLVRPDGHVAWRARQAPHEQDEAVTVLRLAICRILGRSASCSQQKQPRLSQLLPDREIPAT